MRNHYDAIVVGAGPAGAAAALTLAQNGVSVALLERGDFPGSKNMFGGTIYQEPTQELIPAFWGEAPLERAIVSDNLWLMEKDSAVQVGFTGLRFGQEPYNKFSVLRSKFDRWFAGKAVEAGAELFNQALVRDLIYQEGLLGKRKKVVGVKLDGGDTIKSDTVILAEGVNAFLTKESGLRSKIPSHAMVLYVKEVISLPSEKIEERFNLNKGEGANIGAIGFPTAGATGKGGIWTNRDSLSVVVGAYLNQIVERGLSPYQLLQRFKAHPLISRLIQGGQSVEYQAHLIPKGGLTFVPKLYDDGLIVTGDAAVMISGRRGTDLAMITGKIAADTVVQAKAKGDFSEKLMANYSLKLNKTFFMKDIKSAGPDTINYFKKYPDSDYLISNVANNLAYEFFNVGMTTEAEKSKKMKEVITAKQMPLKTMGDLYQGIQNWGVF